MLNVVKAFFSGLSPKEKRMVYITGLVLGLTIFDRLIIGPIGGESRMLDEKIDVRTKQIEKNIRILEYKGKILQDDAAYGSYYAKEGLTQEEMIASFLGEVEEIAKESGAVLSNINPVSVEQKEGYSEFSLTVECVGSMKNMLDFFYSIDNSRRPLRMISFEMSVKNREDYQVKCTLTVLKLIITKAEMSIAVPGERTLYITEKVELE